jgi:MFS family permease
VDEGEHALLRIDRLARGLFAIGQAAVVLAVLLAEAPTSSGYGLGMSATQTGLLLVPAGILSTLTGYGSGALGSRIGHKYPLALGGLLCTVGLALLAFEHDTAAQLVTIMALALGGFGLAIAAMPNLIIGAVPRSNSGEALSFNAVLGRVGFAVGSQVMASILAASAIAGSKLPTSQGFEIAFFVAAAASLTGALLAILIPSTMRRHTSRQSGTTQARDEAAAAHAVTSS